MRTLLIAGHVTHYAFAGRLYAYGPYVCEINLWTSLFPRVIIASPCRHEEPPADCLPLGGTNIEIRPLMETGGPSLRAKLIQVGRLPWLLWTLARAMREADAIHVRCPGNLGLLGVLLAPLFSRYVVAKYAGQWSGYPGEPWTYRFQRALLRSRWWRGPVTVYGSRPEASHVVPFFSSALSDEHMRRARALAGRRRTREPLRIVFVGRLSPAKNVDVLLTALATLRDQGIRTECAIVGDGPERSALERLTTELALDAVTFTGGLTVNGVLDWYEWADALVLVSETEGWPKAIVEGMAFGLVCIGSARGTVPEILGDGRGLIVTPRDAHGLAAALREVAVFPERFEDMRVRASLFGQQYSLERMQEALRELLETRWNVVLRAPMAMRSEVLQA